ncbi:hypothetical protein P9112_004129 [Eukaryota sp. TZLM1-RC]
MLDQAQIDLKNSIVEALTTNGTLERLKATIRADVFSSIQEYSQLEHQSLDTLIINSLIAEYLSFNKYDRSLSVFSPESGLKEPLSRSAISTDLKVHDEDDSLQVPLLYSILNVLRTNE